MTSQSNITIVDPDDSDALAYAKMHVQSWHDTYTGMNGATSDWIKQKTDNRFTDDGLAETRKIFAGARNNPMKYFFKIAKSDAEVVGFVSGQKTSEGQEVGGLYVAQEQQGTGLADRLMAEIMAWFDTDDQIFLHSARDNTRAIRFYEKYGFTTVESNDIDQEKYKPLVIIKMVRKS